MYCLQIRNTSLDDRVGSTVRELVPAVCGSNGDFGEDLLGLLDFAEKLLAVKVATVESFGADSDGLDDIFVSRNASLEGIDILVERFIRIRPKKKRRVRTYITALFKNIREQNNENAAKVLFNIPDSENDLETLGLCRWDDVLRRIAFAGGVCPHKGGKRLQDVKVGLVVAG